METEKITTNIKSSFSGKAFLGFSVSQKESVDTKVELTPAALRLMHLTS